MEYFDLRRSIDSKVIGLKDASSHAKFDEKSFEDPTLYEKVSDFFSMDSYYSRTDHTPPDDIRFSAIWLLKQAKLTDFMTFYPGMMAVKYLISSKVAAILTSFDLASHFLFPAVVVDRKGKTHDYKMLYMPFLEYSTYDFPNSEFTTGDGFLGNRESFIFPSEEVFGYFRKKYARYSATTLKLNDTYTGGTDLMNIRALGFIGSGRLVQALESNGCTGLEYKAVPFIANEK